MREPLTWPRPRRVVSKGPDPWHLNRTLHSRHPGVRHVGRFGLGRGSGNTCLILKPRWRVAARRAWATKRCRMHRCCLGQNHPNPMVSQTTIPVQLKTAGELTWSLWGMDGRECTLRLAVGPRRAVMRSWWTLVNWHSCVVLFVPSRDQDTTWTFHRRQAHDGCEVKDAWPTFVP